jgi:NADH:ubiquinone oxidoreductase subunit C
MERKSKMERYKIGFNYKFDDLEEHVRELNNNEYDNLLEVHGNDYAGESLAVIRSLEHEQCVSFVLVRVKGSEWMYKCVYSDFVKDGGK